MRSRLWLLITLFISVMLLRPAFGRPLTAALSGFRPALGDLALAFALG